MQQEAALFHFAGPTVHIHSDIDVLELIGGSGDGDSQTHSNGCLLAPDALRIHQERVGQAANFLFAFAFGDYNLNA